MKMLSFGETKRMLEKVKWEKSYKKFEEKREQEKKEQDNKENK